MRRFSSQTLHPSWSSPHSLHEQITSKSIRLFFIFTIELLSLFLLYRCSFLFQLTIHMRIFYILFFFQFFFFLNIKKKILQLFLITIVSFSFAAISSIEQVSIIFILFSLKFIYRSSEQFSLWHSIASILQVFVLLATISIVIGFIFSCLVPAFFYASTYFFFLIPIVIFVTIKVSLIISVFSILTIFP